MWTFRVLQGSLSVAVPLHSLLSHIMVVTSSSPIRMLARSITESTFWLKGLIGVS